MTGAVGPDGRAVTVWTVVVAGGRGTRFAAGSAGGSGSGSSAGDGPAKQYLEIAGHRVLDWSVATATAASDGVVVVVPASDVDDVRASLDAAVTVVAGGDSRSASVRCGLAVVPDDVDVVLVHDAARPAASGELFARVGAAVVAGADGAVPGVAVTDSLRHRTDGALDRDQVVAVQTPQGFRAAALRAALALGDDATDDATLVERTGGSIAVVDGEPANRKLTHGDDVALLAAALERPGG